MPGPVERWLETFMCKQYADTFEAFGYQTLQSVSNRITAFFTLYEAYKNKLLKKLAPLLLLSGELCWPLEI